jgi:hypothetical protein
MPSTHSKHYNRLFAMIAFHFVAMYILMYAMVDTIANVHHSERSRSVRARLDAAPLPPRKGWALHAPRCHHWRRPWATVT